MRVLGVDLGRKRIGLAVGESDFQLASPRPFLAASGSLDGDAQAISEVGRREDAACVVVGLALNADGSPSAIANAGMKLAEHLRRLSWRVETVDEAMTSVEAEKALRQSDKTAAQRRKVRDGEAACRILERFFDEQSQA